MGKISKNILYWFLYIGFIYTFQNIYKAFPGSERIGTNYNAEGFGFGIGLEFL